MDRDNRPWGHPEVLLDGDDCKAKRIVVERLDDDFGRSAGR
jgi:hypothetical protein